MSLSWEAMPGDAVANRLLQLAADFVGLVSDKGGAAQRLNDLAAATAAAEAKITEARQARKGADERIAEVKRELAEHADKMLADRQVLQREREALARDRAALLDEATKLRDQARADADQAASKLRELNTKLQAVQAAVSSAA
jgi:chromosome segregation ATPase